MNLFTHQAIATVAFFFPFLFFFLLVFESMSWGMWDCVRRVGGILRTLPGCSAVASHYR